MFRIVSKLERTRVGGQFKSRAAADKECARMNRKGDHYEVVPDCCGACESTSGLTCECDE